MARCLVVDDSKVIQETVKDFLDDLGHQSVVLDQGEPALDLLERDSRFDFLFLDIHLPGVDGIAVLRRVREAWPHIKVIMMTSDRDRETFGNVEEAWEKVDGFLHKPFGRDILSMCLTTVERGGRFRHKKQETSY